MQTEILLRAAHLPLGTVVVVNNGDCSPASRLNLTNIFADEIGHVVGFDISGAGDLLVAVKRSTGEVTNYLVQDVIPLAKYMPS